MRLPHPAGFASRHGGAFLSRPYFKDLDTFASREEWQAALLHHLYTSSCAGGEQYRRDVAVKAHDMPNFDATLEPGPDVKSKKGVALLDSMLKGRASTSADGYGIQPREER